MQVTIEDVLARRAPELMRIDGVEGVGQALCDTTPCIRVYIRTDTVAARLPRTLEGYAVDPVVTGTVRPRTGENAFTSRHVTTSFG